MTMWRSKMIFPISNAHTVEALRHTNAWKRATITHKRVERLITRKRVESVLRVRLRGKLFSSFLMIP